MYKKILWTIAILVVGFFLLYGSTSFAVYQKSDQMSRFHSFIQSAFTNSVAYPTNSKDPHIYLSRGALSQRLSSFEIRAIVVVQTKDIEKTIKEAKDWFAQDGIRPDSSELADIGITNVEIRLVDIPNQPKGLYLVEVMGNANPHGLIEYIEAH